MLRGSAAKNPTSRQPNFQKLLHCCSQSTYRIAGEGHLFTKQPGRAKPSSKRNSVGRSIWESRRSRRVHIMLRPLLVLASLSSLSQTVCRTWARAFDLTLHGHGRFGLCVGRPSRKPSKTKDKHTQYDCCAQLQQPMHILG